MGSLVGRPAFPLGTDSRLGYLSPSALARLAHAADRPVSASSPAVERLFMQVSSVTSPGGQRLGKEALRIVKEVFGNSVDDSRVVMVQTKIVNAPTTLGNQIRVSRWLSMASEEDKSILIHEMVHIWQYQTQGSRYITDSLYHQASSAATIREDGARNAAYYNYRLTERKSFYDYPAEEQAQIIEDYYEMTVRYRNASDLPLWVIERRKDLPIYEKLVQEMQKAIPLAETTLYGQSIMTTPGRPGSVPISRDREMSPLVPILELRF